MYRKLMLLLVTALLLVVPTLAQDAAHTVSFDGFSFTFDEGLARNVNITPYPGDSPELPPGAAEPPYTKFVFYNRFPVPESVGDAIGGVYLYDTAAFEGYTEYQNRLAQLQALVDERSDLGAFEVSSRNDTANPLPFLPVYPAGQVFRARSHYVITDEVQGIAYLTIYQEAMEPFLSDSAVWTFQGISTDGQRYIAAIFNITTDVFPAEIPSDFDPVTFQERYGEYHAKFTAWVNDAGPESFSPRLEVLEEVVESIAFEV